MTNSLVFFSSSEDALISSSFLKDIFILEGDLKKCILSSGLHVSDKKSTVIQIVLSSR